MIDSKPQSGKKSHRWGIINIIYGFWKVSDTLKQMVSKNIISSFSTDLVYSIQQ